MLHVWVRVVCRLMQSLSADVSATLAAALQTAHEPSYLVKHLLGSLPPVVERVKLMRKGQAPNGSSEDNLVKMAQSQVRSLTQSSLASLQLALLHPCNAASGLQRPLALPTLARLDTTSPYVQYMCHAGHHSKRHPSG